MYGQETGKYDMIIMLGGLAKTAHFLSIPFIIHALRCQIANAADSIRFIGQNFCYPDNSRKRVQTVELLRKITFYGIII